MKYYLPRDYSFSLYAVPNNIDLVSLDFFATVIGDSDTAVCMNEQMIAEALEERGFI